MEKFEGQFVGYMLNQAGMPFFMVSSYPHYKLEDGRMVVDRSDESKSLRAQATEGKELVSKIQDRYKRGKRIPRTWVKALNEHKTLVMAIDELRVATREWCDEFYRTLRWLNEVVA